MENKDFNYKIPIFAAGAFFLLLIAFSVGWILKGTDDGKKPGSASAPTSETDRPAVTAEPVAGSFNAIIADVDQDNSVIVLIRLGSSDFEEFTYNGATDIRTAYDKPVTAASLQPGDFVNASYSDENRLVKLVGMSNVDVYKGVKNLRTEPDLKRMTIGDHTYRYDDSLLILNDGYFVGQETLYKTDVLSIYSIDGFVYLLKIMTGHGYLKLSNDSAFIGGSLFVGTGATVQIEENMVLTLTEGTYAVTARNGDLKASATLLVSRDKTAVFDLAPYSPEPVEYSKIRFSITPDTSNLYIDGVLTDYSSAVPVTFGEHYVEVMMTGYTSYEGILTASKPEASLSISLSAAPVIPAEDEIMNENGNETEPADASELTDVQDPDATEDKSSQDDSEDDEELRIHCTEGAAVFINDVYKGTISGGILTIPKPVGEFSVRLTLEGYITRYYIVSVEDDGEDAEFTFPAMVKE